MSEIGKSPSTATCRRPVMALLFGSRLDWATLAMAASEADRAQTDLVALQVVPKLMTGSLAEAGFDPAEIEAEEIAETRSQIRAGLAQVGFHRAPVVLTGRPALRAALRAARHADASLLILPPFARFRFRRLARRLPSKGLETVVAPSERATLWRTHDEQSWPG